MMSMMPLSRRSWVLGLAGALACGERGMVYEGEYVTLIVDPALEPCGDMVGHMDRVVTTLADYLGVSLAGEAFTFIWYSDERFAAEAKCGPWTGACDSEVIWSTGAPVDVTLVRLVLALVGSPPPFFWVGAEAAFTPGNSTNGGSFYPSSGHVQQLLGLGQMNAELGSSFTRFLIDRHGLDAYLAFYASVGAEDPLPVIEAVHAEHFGESLTETDLAFVAERPWCPTQRSRFKLFECSTPPIAWDGDSLLLRRSLACGEDGVVGPFGGQTARSLSTIEVVTAGMYEISLAADEPAAMILAGCGGCEDETEVRLATAAEPVRRWLPAGRYYLQLAGEVDVATELALRIERVDEP